MDRTIITDIFSQDVIDEFDKIRLYLSYKCNLLFDYWQEKILSHRDEFYLTFYVLLMLLDSCKEGEINEWKLKFNVAFLYHIKFLMESCITIDMAIKRNYYTVCYPLLRSVHSNLFLVILSSFNPELFDHWLKNQKDNRYADGNIRNELLSHGLYIYNQ